MRGGGGIIVLGRARASLTFAGPRSVQLVLQLLCRIRDDNAGKGVVLIGRKEHRLA